jgi:hypothetical protein
MHRHTQSLSLDRAFIDEEKEKIYFKLETFQKWLQNTKNYKKKRSTLVSFLRDEAKAESTFVQVNKKSQRCWELDFKLDDTTIEKPDLKMNTKDKDVLGSTDEEEIPF